jgi:hypothetical protein
VAGEQVAGVLIGNRERIAEHAVLGGELALEVRGPEVVGRGGGWGHHAGMLVGPSPPPPLDQALAGEQVMHGTDGGPRRVGMPGFEIVQQLPRAPVGMLPPGRAQELRDLRRDPVRAVVGRAAPIDQTLAAARVGPVQPFVAGFAADPVAGTELGHGVEPLPVIGDERQTLFHGCGLHPRHRPTSQVRGRSCSVRGVSPMFPV